MATIYEDRVGQYEPMLTPEQAGARLGIGAKTLTRWADTGRIKCVRLPSGHRRYRLSDVDAILRDGQS